MFTLASAQSHPRIPSQVCGHGHQGGCAVDHDSNPSKEWLRSKAAWFQNGVRGGFGVRWCGSIGHLANVSFPTSGWYELGSPEGEPVKPQERYELAKHQSWRRSTTPDWLSIAGKSQITLLLAVILNVVILALLAYLRRGRN
jgi:hypothetical protein